MVNSSQVNGDKEKLSSAKSSFNSAVDGLSGSWQGPSYDNLTSQAKSFSEEFFSTVDSQMEAFATACDLYKEFKTCKDNLKEAKRRLAALKTAAANASEDSTIDYSRSINSWAAHVDELTDKKEQLTKDINTALGKAANGELTANNLAETDFSGGAMSTYNSKISTGSGTGTGAGTGTSLSSSGGSTEAGAVQKKAIDWAVSIASDDKYGYGSGGYDCSGLVLQAYKNAGVNLAGANSTGNMRTTLPSAGFKYVSGKPNVNNLQPGDLLWKNGHTEMYIGNGQVVGAHENKDGRSGDSSGNEINVSQYTDKSWSGYFRYTG